jgi:hypothetical protein
LHLGEVAVAAGFPLQKTEIMAAAAAAIATTEHSDLAQPVKEMPVGPGKAVRVKLVVVVVVVVALVGVW